MELSQLIDPVACLKQGKSLQGVVSSEALPRVADVLSSHAEDIAYALQFTRDANKRCVVHCHVAAQLPLLCQRCGQMMTYPVDVTSQLCVVVSDEMAKQLPSDYEPLMVTDGGVPLQDIVEEELLLAIPMIPRHKEGECSPVAVQV